MTKPVPFVVDLKQVMDEGRMEEFQEAMDALYDSMNKEIEELARELDVSEACAQDVWYLRTRSRHTQELEEELIQLHRDGNPPNIMEFGCNENS